jgi:hypothetical protein
MKAKGNNSAEKLHLRQHNIKVRVALKKPVKKKKKKMYGNYYGCDSGVGSIKSPTIMYVPLRADRG